MSVAVWAILGVLAALLLVLALAMATPLRLELSLRKGDSMALQCGSQALWEVWPTDYHTRS